jgi:putative ATPase
MYYDMLSAFCKSLRGSDSSAALYYMNRLISGGCDPLLLARRMLVHASEDVGLADPNALVVAVSAYTAFEKLGLPEGLIPLSEAVIYICEADKSNSVIVALEGAKYDAETVRSDNVPSHLKNTGYKSQDQKQLSKQYKYPHDYGGYVKQQYLPDELKDKKYYIPKNNGYENVIKQIRDKKGLK